MIKKLKEIAKIKFCLAQRVVSEQKHKTLTPMKLLDNNVIDGFAFDDKVRANDDTKICNGDIIIKRISPSFLQTA